MLELSVLSESLRKLSSACLTVGAFEFFTKDDFESGKYLSALNVPFAISRRAAALMFEAYSKL